MVTIVNDLDRNKVLMFLLCEVMNMLANFTVVIISPYIHPPNRKIVNYIFVQCCMTIMF